MNIRLNPTRTLAVLLPSVLFALNVSASGSGGASGLLGYQPMGQHQTRECILLGMLGGQLPPHCRKEAPEAVFVNWRQDFNLATDGWATSADPGMTGWCGTIEQVGIEDLTGSPDEARPLAGDAYAVVRHGECNEFYRDIFPDGAGPASAFRPHNDHFPEGGFVSALHIHLDPEWPVGSGFTYADSFQVLDEEWPNFRYLMVPVERNDDGLYVGDYEVAEAGWYTFSTIFTGNDGSLAADFVLSRHDWPLYRQSLDTTMLTEEPVGSFDVDNVSNAYVIFFEISEDLGLPIDEEQMRRPLDGFGPPGRPAGSLEDAYNGFDGQVFDFTFLPNGNMLVADTDPSWMDNTIVEIGPRGREAVASIPVTVSPINGLEAVGQGTFWATSGGMDLTAGAGLWRVSGSDAELVADISSFTLGDWPDGDPGPYPETWKDFRCEEFANFSHGPQTNPYHLTALSGSEVLIGDAANNGVLWADSNGNVEVVAFMEPPVDPATGDWMVLGYVNEEGEIDPEGSVECYVEPVPTSVAIGPDGAWYVGELTGTTAVNFIGEPSPRGLARVWRIEPGARNVTCPSAACTEVEFDDDVELNTIIDVEFGPDGLLYLVEFEKSGFLGVVAPALEIPLAGSAVKRCDVETGACETLDVGASFLAGGIAFDKWNNLWLLDNVFDPTIRKIDWR